MEDDMDLLSQPGPEGTGGEETVLSISFVHFLPLAYGSWGPLDMILVDNYDTECANMFCYSKAHSENCCGCCTFFNLQSPHL